MSFEAKPIDGSAFGFWLLHNGINIGEMSFRETDYGTVGWFQDEERGHFMVIDGLLFDQAVETIKKYYIKE